MPVYLGWTDKTLGSAERIIAAPRPRSSFTRRLANRLGLPLRHLVWMDQVHGNRVRPLTHRSVSAVLKKTDGCVTTKSGIALCVRTADCLPILLYDRADRAIAALHAGWRGLLEGIVEKGVEELCRASRSRPADLRAVIGPAIHATCYEIGEEVRQAFLAKFGSGARRFFRKMKLSLTASLPAIAASRLCQAGMNPRDIQIDPACTACSPTRFFSFRARKDAGRFASFIFKTESLPDLQKTKGVYLAKAD